MLYAIALISRNGLDINLMLASPWDKKISNSYALKRGTKGKFVFGCSAKALQNADPVSVKKKVFKKRNKNIMELEFFKSCWYHRCRPCCNAKI